MENTDPANFGPGGTVKETITTTLGVVNALSLSTIDMFIAPWISDTDASAFSADVVSFFLGGGDLFWLQDDSGHDALGTALGISTTASTCSPSNEGAPLFDGPFGVASDVEQFYAVGQLSAAEIAAKGGQVGGTNVEGQITSAFWEAGEYAAGAGALFIIADVDMIATTTACGLPICGADYASLDDNAIYALNTFSFISDTVDVPEPGTLALLALGLVGLSSNRRRKAGS